MKLHTAEVQHYKSIEDSGEVVIDPEVTCLVGKNESGKTAFLEAVGRVHPVAGQRSNFDYELEYPRKDLNQYKRRHADSPQAVVTLTFELEANEIEAIEKAFGKGVLTKSTFSVTQDYAGSRNYKIPYDEGVAVRHLLKRHGVPAAAGKALGDAATVNALHGEATELAGEEVAALAAEIGGWREPRLCIALIDRFLSPRMPRFFYFDEYSVMKGRISVPDLQRKITSNELKESDRTFLALLSLVGSDLSEFATMENRERLIASLEAAGNEISDELFEFWSQNRDLRIEFDLSGPDPSLGSPFDEGNMLQVRIRNDRHRVTVPFDQRSRGFVWFFSFLAYFSQLRHRDEPLILLLDEPGLSLHASAQEDFLRYIQERLAPEHQVIYTTHSPFMVEPARLGRVRTVEDKDMVGTKISSEILSVSKETAFPLQAALGYTLAQTLFVGADNLLVEGPSDYLYLKIFSDHLRSQGRTQLDDRWVIVPVGGLEKIPTFLALLNNQLNVAAVIDGSGGGVQRVKSMVDKGVVTPDQIIPVTDITKTSTADIEDFLDEPFYLKLVKDSGVGNITKSKLKAGSRIVKRIEEALGTEYDHYQPARYLLEHPDLVAQAGDDTLANFEQLFETVNKRLT